MHLLPPCAEILKRDKTFVLRVDRSKIAHDHRHMRGLSLRQRQMAVAGGIRGAEPLNEVSCTAPCTCLWLLGEAGRRRTLIRPDALRHHGSHRGAASQQPGLSQALGASHALDRASRAVHDRTDWRTEGLGMPHRKTVAWA